MSNIKAMGQIQHMKLLHPGYAVSREMEVERQGHGHGENGLL